MMIRRIVIFNKKLVYVYIFLCGFWQKNNYCEGMLLLWNMYIRPKHAENV